MEEKKQNVQSVQRTFQILETLAASPNGMSLKDISAACGLAKSTTFRLLACLTELGYARQDRATGSYQLSLRMMELASMAAQKSDLAVLTRPYLEELARISNETVHLVTRDKTEVVYILKTSGQSNGSQMASKVGLHAPMYCTAVGKAMLSTYSEDEVRQIWESGEIKPFTDRTITSLPRMSEELNRIRESGYALDMEEYELGIRCVGFPIRSLQGRAIAAFSISGLAPKMTDEKFLSLAKVSLTIETEIERDLGLLKSPSANAR